MNYIALKGRIERAIQSRPLDIEAHNDLFDLCREYEKVDFMVAHEAHIKSDNSANYSFLLRLSISW